MRQLLSKNLTKHRNEDFSAFFEYKTKTFLFWGSFDEEIFVYFHFQANQYGTQAFIKFNNFQIPAS